MASIALGDPPRTLSSGRSDWQSVLAESVCDPAELCRLLGLEASLAAEAELSAGGFPLLVPRPFLSRIRPGDPADPLLLQVLPRAAETVATPGFGTDPLGEAGICRRPCLLRKYQGRTLIVTTGACSVHCRFCFRRHFLGGWEQQKSPLPEGEITLDLLSHDRTIREVILSGGDPLMLTDGELARLVGELAEIPHLRRLRIHSRMPLTVPQRVTDGLICLLSESRLTSIVVIHINHPAEIDDDVATALGRLIDAGIPVLSQSVLLRGVNDRADVLMELFQRLVDLRVLPYYLHQLDRVSGAAHFEVPVTSGVALMAELRDRLPGYAVPRYVRETPGGTSKEILA